MADLPAKASKAQLTQNAKDVPLAGGGLRSNGPVNYLKNEGRFHRRVFPVKIVTTGPLGTELDYTDCRYWVRLQQNRITNAQFRASDPIDLEDSPVPPFTAYSLSEEPAQTHSLEADSIVEIVMDFFDQPMPGQSMAKAQPRWIILGGSNPFQICTLLADGGSGGSPGVSATYTYSIYALDGNTWGATTGTLLATQCPLFGPRIIAGPCTAAQAGLIWKTDPSGPPGVTGTVGNDPSGSGSGPHPTAYRIIMAYETFGTSVQVGSCP